MFAASLYIIICSARNRFRQRLRRLREPRYLLGAIAGAAYLYFSIFAPMRGARAGVARRRGGPVRLPLADLAAVRMSGPALVGLVLLFMTGLSWLLPVDSGLLDFSEAEIAFLFPAPVLRRDLLIHRMMRSQLGILIGALIVGIAAPSLPGFMRLRIAIGFWFLLITSKVYFTGVTLARARLTSASGSARAAAWLPLGVVAAALAIVAIPLIRDFSGQPVSGLPDGMLRLGRVALTGTPHVALWPFIALARPFFAAWPGPYLQSLAWAAVIFLLTVMWVVVSDGTFQDAAEEVARKRAASRAVRTPAPSARATGLPLGLTGRPEMAFAWKAALQTLRVADRRVLARFALTALSLSAAAVSFSLARRMAVMPGVFAAAGAGFTMFMAPQVLRIDMRQDLRHLELLKTWPVGASAILRGEMIWPATLVTAISWGCLGLAFALSADAFTNLSLHLRLAVTAAAMIVAPTLVFAQFAIHNAVAVMFPAWVPLGNQRARGLDAMGQRLIMLGGTWLMLIAMALPGAIAGGIVWFAARPLLGWGALVAGAAVCAVIVGIEVLLATEMLGPSFERLDVTDVERAE
jgi:ABC-2 type transport system permease protein